MENHQIACPRETGSNGAALQVSAPLPPKPVLKSCEPNPYQTTFVQADASSFKQVVQMLTGTAETAAAIATPQKQPIAPGFMATGPKKPAFKLYERRNGQRNISHLSPLALTISQSCPGSPVGGAAAGLSPCRQPEIVSPSMLDFPSLALSPVTPLSPDPFNRPTPHPNSEAGKWAEDRAIAEKGFYLHPSPRALSTAAEPPQLLPLFPVTSPKLSSDLSLSVPQSFGGDV